MHEKDNHCQQWQRLKRCSNKNLLAASLSAALGILAVAIGAGTLVILVLGGLLVGTLLVHLLVGTRVLLPVTGMLLGARLGLGVTMRGLVLVGDATHLLVALTVLLGGGSLL